MIRSRPRAFIATIALAAALAPAGCNSAKRIDVSQRDRSVAEGIERARLAQEAKDPARAVALYQEAVQFYPEFAAAWNNLGRLLMDSQQYLDAAVAFSNAAENAPTDPRPLYNLGLTWDRAGYADDALRIYKQALARDPRYLPALRGAVRIESLLVRFEPETLERIRMALGQETDADWRLYFETQRAQVEQQLFRDLSPGALPPAVIQPPRMYTEPTPTEPAPRR